jgi:hypothetical protein
MKDGKQRENHRILETKEEEESTMESSDERKRAS